MNEIKQLKIESAEAYELASEIARRRGSSLAEAVVMALRGEAERARLEEARAARIESLLELGRRYRQLPNLDTRSADEILGYDEDGLPT